LNKEKTLIGIFLSAHPLDEWSFEINEMCTITAAELNKFDTWCKPDARKQVQVADTTEETESEEEQVVINPNEWIEQRVKMIAEGFSLEQIQQFENIKFFEEYLKPKQSASIQELNKYYKLKTYTNRRFQEMIAVWNQMTDYTRSNKFLENIKAFFEENKHLLTKKLLNAYYNLLDRAKRKETEKRLMEITKPKNTNNDEIGQ
jgi:hypothetical protein